MEDAAKAEGSEAAKVRRLLQFRERLMALRLGRLRLPAVARPVVPEAARAVLVEGRGNNSTKREVRSFAERNFVVRGVKVHGIVDIVPGHHFLREREMQSSNLSSRS